jgi:hypothetical protein
MPEASFVEAAAVDDATAVVLDTGELSVAVVVVVDIGEPEVGEELFEVGTEEVGGGM